MMFMKTICDLHTHSVLSNHGYSSLSENILAAVKMGLKYYGISEHQAEQFGVGAKVDAFNALYAHCPRMMENTTILRGCEFNILPGGTIEKNGIKTEKLDYGIASMHYYSYKFGHSVEEMTHDYLSALDYDFVKILGHIHDSRFPCDYEAVIKKCKEKHILIEINNSKVNRPDHMDNVEIAKEVLKICKREKLPIIINSDAHIMFEIGHMEAAEKLVEEMDYPKELIVNYNEELFKEYFIK